MPAFKSLTDALNPNRTGIKKREKREKKRKNKNLQRISGIKIYFISIIINIL